MIKVESLLFVETARDARHAVCRQMLDTDAEVVRIVEDGSVVFEARLDEHGWTVIAPLKINPS